jgi:hypothetical protein
MSLFFKINFSYILDLVTGDTTLVMDRISPVFMATSLIQLPIHHGHLRLKTNLNFTGTHKPGARYLGTELIL